MARYAYITNHGLGPNSCPEGLAGFECLKNFKTRLFFERPLTQVELETYDIKPEWEEN